MIDLKNLAVSAGQFRLAKISLTVPAGAYGVLMGRTGCGKTTLLETICGLKQTTAGSICVSGVDITKLKPAARGIGYVPQEGALFSRMTVRRHLAFPLEIRRWPKEQIAARVHELAALLGIAHLLDRRPAGLSGGEAQRVALGRALSFGPSVLCLDEPLSALDHETRLQICALLKDINQRTGVTVLHVTHDHAEAARLADCLFRLDEGKIETLSPHTIA